MPALQLLQEALLAVGTCPAGHDWQACAPGLLLVPRGQARQVAFPAGAYVPALQLLQEALVALGT